MSNLSRDALLRKIQELSFVKVECELFLDTHPECKMALDHYRKAIEELDTYMEEYQMKYGPILATASHGDRWSWVETPWPWQLEKGEAR